MKTTCFMLLLSVTVITVIAQTSNGKSQVLMDIGHGQVFWNDPTRVRAAKAGPDMVDRLKYMTGELVKTTGPLNAGIGYLSQEISAQELADCDLLFIHIPTTQYSPAEVRAITEYVRNGGSLFLTMEADYWTNLEKTNVNDLMAPFGIQFGGQSADTESGGYTKSGVITQDALKVSYHGGRSVTGGTPFCFVRQTDNAFGVFRQLENGGKIVAMGDGMVSLYMTEWEGVTGYQCQEFMRDVLGWLLE